MTPFAGRYDDVWGIDTRQHRLLSFLVLSREQLICATNPTIFVCVFVGWPGICLTLRLRLITGLIALRSNGSLPLVHRRTVHCATHVDARKSVVRIRCYHSVDVVSAISGNKCVVKSDLKESPG